MDFKMRHGIYHEFDGYFLYTIIKTQQPKNILELSCGSGRTTSCIVNGIDKADNYYIFEKHENELNEIKNYVKDYKKCNYIFGGNIFNFDITTINKLDFLLIDSFHDYILAKWYVDNLFPLVSKAVRARARLGEITNALVSVFGRYKPIFTF